jgi:hypothetical protein
MFKNLFNSKKEKIAEEETRLKTALDENPWNMPACASHLIEYNKPSNTLGATRKTFYDLGLKLSPGVVQTEMAMAHAIKKHHSDLALKKRQQELAEEADQLRLQKEAVERSKAENEANQKLADEKQRAAIYRQTLLDAQRRRDKLLARNVDEIWTHKQSIDDIILMFTYIDADNLVCVQPETIKFTASGRLYVRPDIDLFALSHPSYFKDFYSTDLLAHESEFDALLSVSVGTYPEETIRLGDVSGAAVFWVRYQTDDLVFDGEPAIIYSHNQVLFRAMQRDYVSGRFGVYGNLPYHDAHREEMTRLVALRKSRLEPPPEKPKQTLEDFLKD